MRRFIKWFTVAVSAMLLTAAAPNAGNAPEAEQEAAIQAKRLQRLEVVPSLIFERLGLRPLESAENVEFLAFIYVQAFESEFAIRVDSFPERARELENGQKWTEPAFALLHVVERRDRQVKKENKNAARHTITNMDTYDKELPPVEFQRLTNGMISAGFEAATPIGPPNLCFDGNYYILFAYSEAGRRLIYRHDCDKNYSSDVTLAKPLFDLVSEEVPSARTLIQQVSQEIESRYQR